MRDLWSPFIVALPLLVFALATLALSAFAGVMATLGANQLLHLRIRARLLCSVAAHASRVSDYVKQLNPHIYLRLNGRDHSWQKVLSPVVRGVKPAFQKHGISMPDEARQVIFPLGMPVHVLQAPAASDGQAEPSNRDANT